MNSPATIKIEHREWWTSAESECVWKRETEMRYTAYIAAFSATCILLYTRNIAISFIYYAK